VPTRPIARLCVALDSDRIAGVATHTALTSDVAESAHAAILREQ
jgi:hypothetical protein